MVMAAACNRGGYRTMLPLGSTDGARLLAGLSGLVVASVTTSFHTVDGVAVLDPSVISNGDSLHESNVELAEPAGQLSLSNGIPFVVLAVVGLVAVSVVIFLLAVTWRHQIHPSLAVIVGYLKSTGSSMLSSSMSAGGQSNAGRRKSHRRRLRLPGATSLTFARPVVDRCCGSAPDSAAESPFEDSSSSESGGGGPWAPRLLEMLARQQERSKRQQRAARTAKMTEVTSSGCGKNAVELGGSATLAGCEDFFACSTPSSGFQTPLELLPTDCEEGSYYGTDSPRLMYFSRKLVLLPDD